MSRPAGRWLVRRIDWLLCQQDLSATTLNWKGRVIERLLALRPNWLLRRLYYALGLHLALQSARQSAARGTSSFGSRASRLKQVSWRRAFVERLRWLQRVVWHVSLQIAKMIKRKTLRGLWVGVNNLCFAAYWTLGRLRPRTTVKSVLQFSIISHKPYMLSRVLRQEGLKSEYFALNVGPKTGILDVGWDYSLPVYLPPYRRAFLEVFYLWTVLARYDVIHSHFKTLLSHTGWEFEFLKRLGKVVVFHYRGCDIRHRSLNLRLQPVLNCCQECEYPVGSCDTDYQRSQVAITTKYGDVFFVTTPDLRDFVPRSEHIPFIHPVGMDFSAIAAAPRLTAAFRVVTSSNHHGIDGTRFIRDAVERLRAEGRAIELIEVNHVPYRDALAVYKSADVYIGKLRMGYYNNANIETMMLGVPNMSYIREDFRSIAPDCPIIPTRPEQVYERLLYYLDRPDELRAIGARGPAFVSAHHNPNAIVRRMMARYNEAFADKGPRHDVPQLEPTIQVLRQDLTPVELRK